MMTTTTIDTRVLLSARLLMAAIFVLSGARKALAFAGTAGYFAKLGLPMPEAVTALVILIEVGGGLALIAGWQLKPLALAMAAFTLATAFIGHAFWAVPPEQFGAQLNNFMKNLAMVGGFVLLAGTAGLGFKSSEPALRLKAGPAR
jgi:putative oxidoreductase